MDKEFGRMNEITVERVEEMSRFRSVVDDIVRSGAAEEVVKHFGDGFDPMSALSRELGRVVL
jgi:hypothetical protein